MNHLTLRYCLAFHEDLSMIAIIGTSDQSCWLAEACRNLSSSCDLSQHLFDSMPESDYTSGKARFQWKKRTCKTQSRPKRISNHFKPTAIPGAHLRNVLGSDPEESDLNKPLGRGLSSMQ